MLFKTTHTNQNPPAHLAPGFALYTALTIAICIWVASPTYLSIEQSTGLHWLFDWRGERAPPEDIAIVALNSRASETLELNRNTSQWPRSIYAELLNTLQAAGAKMVVMDIAFKETRTHEEDQALAQAMSQLNIPLILFTYIKRQELEQQTGSIDIIEEIPPIPQFAIYANAYGPFTLPKFPAHIVKTHIAMDLGGDFYLSQPLLAYLHINHATTLELANILRLDTPSDTNQKHTAPPTKNHALYSSLIQQFYLVQIQNPDIFDNIKQGRNPDPELLKLIQTLERANEFYINFYGPDRTLLTLDVDDVLSQTRENLQHYVAGKTVYIGFSDYVQTEQRDAYRTVFSKDNGIDLSGVEISASVFSNLQDGSTLNPLSKLYALFLMLIFAIGGFSLGFYWHFRYAFALTTLCLAVYIGLAYYIFVHYFIWLPITSLILAALTGAGLSIIYRYQRDVRRVALIENALSQYVPHAVAKKLSKPFQSFETEKQLVYGVCMMTDIKGYTRLSENTPPEQLHQLMNRYYDALIQEVEKRGGMIANIVGDSLLSLWTAPTITPALCLQATETAFAIAKAVEQNHEFKERLPTCFALHGGQFSLGNLGAKGHYEYSPVGDIINTTSRIEPINRTLKTQMLCSTLVAENLYAIENQAMKDTIFLRNVGNFPMRNKSEPFTLFELSENVSASGTELSVAAHKEALQCEAFDQGLTFFKSQEFDQAQRCFEKVLESAPSDGPSHYYLNAISQQDVAGAKD